MSSVPVNKTVPDASAAGNAGQHADGSWRRAAVPLASVLWEPGKTFACLVREPTWWLPFVIGAVLAAVLGTVMIPKVDFERSLRQEAAAREARTGLAMPKEQIERISSLQQRIAPFFPFLAPLGFAFYFFFAVGVLRVATDVCGSEATPKQILSVFSYAQVPNLLASALALVVVARAADRSMTVEQMRTPLLSSLAAFLPDGASPALTALASSCDLFTLTTLALLMIGFGRLPEISRRAGGLIPVCLWAAYVALKVGWKAIFS